MSELFSSGHAVDIILVLVLLQGLLIKGAASRFPGLRLADYCLAVLPGICLLLALRAALVQAQWNWIAACLLAALLAHWLELWRRSR